MRGFDLRRSQTVWAIRPGTLDRHRIELALRGVLDHAVLDAVERVALGDGGFVQDDELIRRDQTGLVPVRRLPKPDLAEGLTLREIRGSTGDDGVEVERIALRFGERLASTGRTPVEVRPLRRVAVVRRRDGLRGHGHLVNGALLEVHELLGMADHEVGVAADVTGIGADRRIARQERRRHRTIRDGAGPRAVANGQQFSVPYTFA